MDDWQTLRNYVDHNSEEAFAALMARYVGLVYSVCRRELADDQAAEDVTQAVFLLLARKAHTLRRGVILSGWLFQTARFAAKNARLQAQRRWAYEQKAAEEMLSQTETEDAAWADIEPVLNQSLAALRAADRDCILLRFFQGLSFVEVGIALGLSEEAARKRVTRALEKMRQFFGKNGVIVPGATLAVVLSAHAAKAAPAHLSGAAAHILAGSVPGSISLITEGVLHAMKIAQIKLALGVTGAVVLGFSTYAIARGIYQTFTLGHKIQSLAAFPKPGHILAQNAAKSLTSAQIASRCREAYAALTSYQGNSTVTDQTVSSSFPIVLESHASASIQFVPSGKIHVEGTAERGGGAFAYISNGSETAATYLGPNNWKKIDTTENAVAGTTGIALRAGTTIPAVLLNINWGNCLRPRKAFDTEVREDTMADQPCYVVTSHSVTPARSQTDMLWIDEKTYMLRRRVVDSQSQAQTVESAGKTIPFPAMQSHADERFTITALNATIPESAFTLPPTP